MIIIIIIGLECKRGTIWGAKWDRNKKEAEG
jgi:hypothetical protein